MPHNKSIKSEKIHLLLKQRRELCGFSVENVVERLERDFGIKISEKTLYGYENGVSMPKVPTFMALCTIYGVSDLYHEFGYSVIDMHTSAEDWSLDLYNDFFNATLLEKIYLLLRHGVPSFDGYEDRLTQSMPNGAEAANFDRLYSIFSSLEESEQNTAFFMLNELAEKHQPNLTFDEAHLVSLFRNAQKDTQSAVLTVLENCQKC